jgi:diguanylate cyclase (GGDEF)-like protein
MSSSSERIGPRFLLPVAAAAGYLATLVLAFLLPPFAAAVALAALLGLAVLARRAPHAHTAAGLTAFLPLHVLLVATGGFGSPALPLLAGWAAIAAVRLPLRLAGLALAGAALLLAAAAYPRGTLDPAGGLEAAFGLLVGVVIGSAARRWRRSAEERRRALDRLVGEAEIGVESPTADAARRRTELRRALDRLRAENAAARAVLWEVDASRERAQPVVISGNGAPPALVLRGDPLGWAIDERLPLRLEAPPRWSVGSGATWAVPVDADAPLPTLLTLELVADHPEPAGAALEAAAAALKELGRAHDRERDASHARARFDMLVSLLDRLSADLDIEAFGVTLARTAAELAGASGAVVAVWDGEHGSVVVRIGEDGGPEPGSGFRAGEGELALAARAGTPLSRVRRPWEHAQLPVAATDERWLAPPRYLEVIPLGRADTAVEGVLALWSGERPLDAPGLAGLHAVASFAGVQLRHAVSYGSMRSKAELDALTGVPNRRAFDERFAAESARSARYRRPLSVVLLDVDRFKAFNDTFGHDTGDEVLRAVGGCLRNTVRGTDFAARYGGEEFVLLLPETGLAAAREAAERLRARIEAVRVEGPAGEPLAVTASLGVSTFPDCAGTTDQLLRSADAMLYAAKEGGRNRVAAAPLSHVLP